MANKVRVHITGVEINAPTYKGVTFEPSMINFFFGGNGTGKSTLAKSFKDNSAKLTWDGDPFPDDRILVYNEDFIRKNVQSYGNIPGVFTISETNAEKKKLADQKSREKKALEDEIKTIEAKKRNLDREQCADDEAYLTDVWNKSVDIRKKYGASLSYLRDRKKFAGKIEEYKPIASDMSEVDKLYKTVWDSSNSRAYNEYKLLATSMPSSPLTRKPIISRSNTEFAKFIRALGNLDWVTSGHTKYHDKTGGKCPYCQQILPATFSDSLASCYDEQYTADKNSFSEFIAQYKAVLNGVYQTCTANMNNPWITPHDVDYKSKYELFQEKAKANMTLLHQKETNLSEEIDLEDLSQFLHDLNNIAEDVNKEIQKFHSITRDIPAQKLKLSETLWSHLAYDCADIIEKHRQARKDREIQQDNLNSVIIDLKTKVFILNADIIKLNSETVNTTKAMNDINAAIKTAGFKGFMLREKPGTKYVYELVRQIGENKCEVVNQDLSEGERHFIAFSYFYHMVMGSQSDEGRVEDKIVIIDDPVSSMDSGIMHMVAALTRQMIGICYNNYDMEEGGTDDHIRQIFCLTHNTVFFRDITFNRLADYECASFFEITKNPLNQTTIEECTDELQTTGGGKINRSPVRNGYDALWHQYLTTEDPETLMIVIRQILDAYFIQMFGYKNVNLRRDLLDKKKDRFIRISDDGIEDRSDLITAEAMIALLNIGATNYNDGLYYDPSSVNTTYLRNIFKRIFYVLEQNQHFDMMTARVR